MNKYMFDTNIYNQIIDGSIKFESQKGRADFFATHVQIDELRKTSDSERKNVLLGIFNQLIEPSDMICTETPIWEVSVWDGCKFNDDTELYESIKKSLDSLNKNKKNNIQDALIADTAIKNKIILVTHDSHLYNVATKHKCLCVNLYMVLRDIG